MIWSSFDGKHKRRLRAACAGLALIAAGVSLSACSQAEGEPSGSYEEIPEVESAEIEPIKGTDVMRVKFTAEAARRVGLQTAQVRDDGQQKIIPYAALIYDPEGNTFTYTNPERLTYVRQGIEVERVDGDRVMLSSGPPVGTKVVTVGATEVYGTEFEVAH